MTYPLFSVCSGFDFKKCAIEFAVNSELIDLSVIEFSFRFIGSNTSFKEKERT